MVRLPYATQDKPDTTSGWVRGVQIGPGIAKPTLILRAATDSNYIMNSTEYINGQWLTSKALMNVITPGQRVFGAISWDVTESVDNVTQTAKISLVNALPISKTSTTLTAPMQQQYHDPTLLQQWVKNSFGVPVNIGTGLTWQTGDPTSGVNYQEGDLVFRVFNNEAASVASIAGFPDPKVPLDENDSSTYYPSSAAGQGAYFLLISDGTPGNDEVVKVIDYAANYFVIPPGGRGINGNIQYHGVGSTVSLLGYKPWTGRWTAPGYMAGDQFRHYKSMFRAGTCFASYEGWGDVVYPLSKGVDPSKNYCFTGYWFVQDQESNLSDDGQPQLDVNLLSPGYVLTHQKITRELVRSAAQTYSNWTKAIFDQQGHVRNIPGDWVDFSAWDPSLPNSYPLQIKTELAQHKAFFDHMNDTTFGKTCEVCQQEWTDYVSDPRHQVHQDYIKEAHSVGKHIYKESIRVFRGDRSSNEAGPVRTFLRLMIALGVGAWENSLVGNSLAQRWTKMPNELFTNLRSFDTGLIWNCTPTFVFQGEIFDAHHNSTFDYTNMDSQDREVYGAVQQMMCPFEATYDNQEFVQPCLDLADTNVATFTINRRGFPVFIPHGFKLRGNTGQQAEWHLSWGQSIATYSQQINADSVITLAYVTATDCFDNDFVIAAAGTNYDIDRGKTILYSNIVGNKEAIEMTSGVHQTDTVSLDHLVLGLDWNTSPAGWSTTLVRTEVGGGTQTTEISKYPSFSKRTLTKDDTGPDVVKVQRFINFLRMRSYIGAIPVPGSAGTFAEIVEENGKYNDITKEAVKKIQNFLKPTYYPSGDASTGNWNRHTITAVQQWIQVMAEFIKMDVWWYAMSGYDWEYYTAAITGIKIPEIPDGKDDKGNTLWIVDQLALRQNVINWQKHFAKQAVNVGNKAVNDSVNKAAVRTVSSNIADPRIEVGDVIWLEVPGYLSNANNLGAAVPPFNNGMYVTQVSRNMDLANGTYKANYSGYRYSGQLQDGIAGDPANYYKS